MLFQNAFVVQIRNQSLQMGFRKRFICKVYWTQNWKNGQDLDKPRKKKGSAISTELF